MIRYETNTPMSQLGLRQRIARLERQQADRIETVADVKKKLDDTIERAQLEIENLKAQQTIGVAR